MPSLAEVFNLPINLENPRIAFDEIASILTKNYIKNPAETARRVEARKRKELYNDAGLQIMDGIIGKIFTDPEVCKLRKQIAPWANFDNSLKRGVNEQSMVYLEPPRRRVRDDNENYQRVIKLVWQDEMFKRANQWMNLFNDVLIWFRVPEHRAAVPATEDTPAVESVRVPVMDVISPDELWAIAHPSDPKRWVGVIINQQPQLIDLQGKPGIPHFVVWSDTAWFKLDSQGRFLPETWRTNPFGVIPGVLIHKEPPDGALLTQTPGADLVSAHLMAWLENTMLVKESKSVNKQVAFTGDLSSTPTGQSQDSEADMILGEGVGAQTIDRGVDLRQYMETADHIVERALGNHGIPPSILRHAGTTSGWELQLRRQGLRELRRDQLKIFRSAEREFARIQSAVLARDMPELAFSTEGWAIDFAEVETPLSPQEQLQVFETERRLGLTDTLEFLMKRNPDLKDDNEAMAEVIDHIAREVIRNQAMRPLQQISGSMGQSLEEAQAIDAQSPAAQSPAAQVVSDADTQPALALASQSVSSGDNFQEEESIKARADAAAVLIRAGFKPEDAARVAGLPSMAHLGLQPVTLKSDND